MKKSAFRYLTSLTLLLALLSLITPAHGFAHEVNVPVLLADVFTQQSALSPLNEGQPSTPDSGTIHFEHLTSEDGLSSDIVWSVLQDSDGFIWIGTLDGLNRFDGNSFKVYKHDVNDPDSLGDSSVQVLVEDQARNLWLGSWGGGLNKFNPTTEQFTQYLHDPNNPNSLSSNRVQAIFEDDEGFIWVGTAAGLNRLDPSTHTFTHYKNDPNDPNSLSNNNVQALQGDQTGALWMGTNGGGLDRFDRGTGRFTHFQHDPADPNSISSNNVWAVYEDRSGILWIGTRGGGLNQFDRDAGQFTAYQHDPDDPNSLSDNLVMSIVEDHDGVLWVGSRASGLNQFDRTNGKFLRYPHVASNPRSLSHNGAVTLYVDQVGSLWIGTNGGGVNKLDRNRKPFSLFRHNPGDPASLSSNDVRAIWEDQSGVLWIGTRNGLNRSDLGSSSAQFTLYPNDPTDPNSLGYHGILSIVEDRTGTLWFGSVDLGLNKYNHETGQFIRYMNDPSDSDSLSTNIVRALYVDRENTLWIGTFGGGLNRFDGEVEQFVRYQHDPKDPNSLSDDTIMFINEDQFGDLWVGTLGGLNRIVNGKDQFIRYFHDPNDPTSLSHNSAITIFEDQGGTLWIATNGGGINKFDRENEQFIHYRAVDGLPSDTIMGITEDDQGFLWISTSQGLSKFNPQLETFRNYDSSDGLQGNQFNFNSVFKSHNGELYFGGVNGFNKFSPSAIQDNPNIPLILITDFQLANMPVEIGSDSVLQKSIIKTDELILSHRDRVISFEFAALNYTSPQKNRYRYMLEGFDETWTEVGSDRRFVTYTNLDPREYVLRVTGSNNDGVWNEAGASLALTITPPWWETTWFRGSMILLLVGIVAGVFIWQLGRRQAREQELEALVTAGTQELRFAQAQIGALFKNSPLAIGTASIKGEILSANDAMTRIFGYSKDELIGVNVTDFFPDPEQRSDLMKKLIEEKTIQVPVIQLRRRDGSMFYANLTESILTRDDQDVLLGVVNDITRQVLAEQALKEKAEASAIADERNRLARELHDSVTQSLYTTSLLAEALPEVWESHPEEARQSLKEIRRINQGALAEMRTLLLELRPGAIAILPLGDLLRQLTDALSARSNQPIVISTMGECKLSAEVQVSFYRIAQEALNNIVKHARATKAWVNLRCSADEITLRIRDNGRGYNTQIEAPHNLGLKIMRERAQDIEAELIITSQPDRGTEIRVQWRRS